MSRAFISHKLPDAALAIARTAAEIDVWSETVPIPRAALLDRVSRADGLLCLLTDRIDPELLDAAPRLRVVSQMAVGYDNIDVAACTARGIPVGNTPGVLTETTADLAFALLMATARNVTAGDRAVRDGSWRTWTPMWLTGPDIHHATLGIVGMGRIGFEVARRAMGFQMRLLYSDVARNEEAERQFGAMYVPLETLLRESDFISVHCLLSAETRHLIGAEQFALMRPTAIFVNTSRGGVVDQAAMTAALQDRRIAGAGLDVFEVEPLPATDPLLKLDNVVLLPHIASASVATRTKMAVLAAENLAAGIECRPLPHCVNPDASGHKQGN
jgi:lactate dehydrogenase-like 2-hydroxyacid dehydrogenase